MRNVLISGAGVAGLVLAYWLRRNGFSVTVVERAPGLRRGGQAVDIRGVALEVMERMGLGERMRAARTRMRGMSMMDGDGNELFRSEERTFSSGRLDSEDVELLREDLVAMLYEATRGRVEYVFDDSISTLQQDENGVRVQSENGVIRAFDIVIGADGARSIVRRLAFRPEQHLSKHLGQYAATFSMTNFLKLDNWQMWFRDETAGAGGALYPVRGNTELRITLGFISDPVAYDYRDIQQQKQIVTRRLAGVGWETPKLLAAMADAPDFSFDAMAQIHMDRWSVGRVALVGDAGYCASPLSGQGTSLALVGAYVLAEELSRPDIGHAAAFAAYERRMRPFVALNQALATENPTGPPAEESVERAKYAISLDAAGPDAGAAHGDRGHLPPP
ncbi:FAD-dependent monooxygenase [Nonomuraea sp. NPDC050783]|uniref:FAD-dependent monooxygenase n=1 Tax=Nonomuraea sp. NPDC050783 TaxID=3154634 RepID=UPI003466FDB7